MSDVDDRRPVFISHSATDVKLADALRFAFDDLFGRGHFLIHYSSSKDEGGVKAGTDWFQWIVDRVQNCDVAFVLLTPTSVQRPWIPWEAGAVYGSALTSAGDDDRVIPLLFQITSDELPSPFQQVQVERGDTKADVRKVFSDLLIRFKVMQSDAEHGRAFENLGGTVSRYLKRVQQALATAPMTPTEAAIQEWCRRLDDYRAERRFSEASNLHDWLDLAFGRSRKEAPRPLDLRIHRRLGELYLEGKNYAPAAAQFELCRKVAPRDIFVLRALGQAYLEYDKLKAGKVIDSISALDKEAFEVNADCAGLKAKWLIAGGHPDLARDVYASALERNPNSYYLAGRLAQIQLELKDPAAQESYARLQRIIEGLEEQNVWTRGDAATAAVVTGNVDAAVAQLSSIADLKPSERQVTTIADGLRRLVASLGPDAPALEPLLHALDGALPAPGA
jgi:hypothetical protein